MANNFVGHVDKWLLLSESETDFAVLFVRAWIPFNAWYCNHYQSTSDRTCIDFIKSDGNQFRAKLVALLQGDFPEAIQFKNHLGHLHNLLEQHPIPEANPDKQITFRGVWFRENPITTTNPPIRKRQLEYKAERLSNGSVKAIIVDTRTVPNPTVYNYTHTKYDLVHFQNDTNTNLAGNAEQRLQIEACFKEINPKRKESVITNVKKDAIEAGGVLFFGDANLVSQAIIEIFYGLRCKLFHGELQPSRDNLTVYEPCYHMLRILLKSLK